jgi:flagellin-like hook-associated protein FlgL
MSISLNTNLAASQADFDIARHSRQLAAVQNQLTSGSQLDGPKLDAGKNSLTINLRAALARTSAATNNVTNAISFLQAQQAGLQHLHTILGRMADLSTQMQDAIQTTADLDSSAAEFVSLQREMIVLKDTQFNGTNLFSTAGGADSTMSVIVSEDALQSVTIDRANLATVQTYNLSTVNPGAGFTPDNYNVTWFAADITLPTADPIANPTFFSTMEVSLESVAQLLTKNASQQGLLLGALNSLRQNTITIEQTHGQNADTDISEASREMFKANALVESGSLAKKKSEEVSQTFLQLLTPIL